MDSKRINQLNEVIEGLHWGQVIEFEFRKKKYALEGFQRKGDSYHSLCLFVYDKSEIEGSLVFADRITFFGAGDYPMKFQDNYPTEEIKEILARERVFDGKSFFEAFEGGEIEIDYIDQLVLYKLVVYLRRPALLRVRICKIRKCLV